MNWRRGQSLSATKVNAARLAVFLGLASCPAATVQGQGPTNAAPARTILAVGAHAGDMELTAGAVLLKQRQQGDRVVLLHLTLGEGGNPKLASDVYGAQKRREAIAAGTAMGAEVLFGPYRDGELPNTDEARRYVADVIRQVQPTTIITHWRESIHKDHATASAVVRDAVLLASLDGVRTNHAPHRGVRGVWYAENWEDAEEFRPYIYVDVTGMIPKWREVVSSYEFVRGGISAFGYLEYYTALATVRGAEARRGQAEAFEIDAIGKRRVLDGVP